MTEHGYSCEAIIVSHLQPDHFGGESALQKHLFDKFSIDVPISAHPYTAESLKRKVEIETFIHDRNLKS